LIKKGEFSLEGEIWDHMSEEVKDLLNSMLCREDKRLSAQEVFNHPWFEYCAAMETEEESHAKQQIVFRALSNLRNFSSKHKVKQAALGFLIQHFTNVSETYELEQVF